MKNILIYIRHLIVAILTNDHAKLGTYYSLLFKIPNRLLLFGFSPVGSAPELTKTAADPRFLPFFTSLLLVQQQQSAH